MRHFFMTSLFYDALVRGFYNEDLCILASLFYDGGESFKERSLVISHWPLGKRKKDGISNIEQGISNVEGKKDRRIEGEKLRR